MALRCPPMPLDRLCMLSGGLDQSLKMEGLSMHSQGSQLLNLNSGLTYNIGIILVFIVKVVVFELGKLAMEHMFSGSDNVWGKNTTLLLSTDHTIIVLNGQAQIV